MTYLFIGLTGPGDGAVAGWLVGWHNEFAVLVLSRAWYVCGIEMKLEKRRVLCSYFAPS